MHGVTCAVLWWTDGYHCIVMTSLLLSRNFTTTWPESKTFCTIMNIFFTYLSVQVNLKEQGQLIRQDEFLVCFRKKKHYRHIFLFQDLILFSKTKKTEAGNDIYIYKQSFKVTIIYTVHSFECRNITITSTVVIL